MKRLMKFSSLFMIAFIMVNCSKDDTPTISNLDFTITTGDDPLAVSVTPSANGAESFKIYFDATGDASTYSTSTGDAVAHTYPAVSASYTIKVVASNSNGAEDVERTKTHNVTYIPPRLMAGFENADEFVIRVDSGMAFETAGNPSSSGNDSANALQVTSAGGAYEAIIMFPAKAIDMTQEGKQTISFDFYNADDAENKLAVKLEGAITDSSDVLDVEIEKTVAGSGWQNVEFDFATERRNSYPYGPGQPQEQGLSALDSYVKLVVFIGFGTETTGTFFIDNISGGADGITIPDTDGDSVIDSLDNCPEEVGSTENSGCPVTAPLVLTLTVPDGSTSVRLTGPWWGWNPTGGPEATDNGDGTWSFTFDPAPTDNMEYLYVVDGAQENLVDNAANAECSGRIDGGRMITDYANYANRIWIRNSGDFSEVYDSCD